MWLWVIFLYFRWPDRVGVAIWHWIRCQYCRWHPAGMVGTNIQVQLYIITNVRLLCRLGACPCHFQMLVRNFLRYVVVKGTVPSTPFICWKCLHVAVFQCMVCQSRQFGKEGVSLNFKTILVIGGVWSWVEMGGCKSHTLQGSRKMKFIGGTTQYDVRIDLIDTLKAILVHATFNFSYQYCSMEMFY